MKKIISVKTVVGILCILAIILVAVFALFLDSQSPDPIFGIFRTPSPTPTESAESPTSSPSNSNTENNQGENNPSDEVQLTPPADLPSSVVIPVEKKPNGESFGLIFPCKIPKYDLTIEKLAPYEGLFVEDGSNVNKNVAMLLIHNTGKFPVEYTQIKVDYDSESLIFDISALPVGEKMVVQEKTGKPVPEGTVTSATAMVVQRADMEMSKDKVSVTDNGNNTLTIKNLTNEAIPTVRVFYKYYMENEDIFVGGIAFTVRVTRLGAGASVTLQPSHYNSQTSRVVMVLTYDSEV